MLLACHAPNVAGEVINVAAGGRVSLARAGALAADHLPQRHSSPSSGPAREGDVKDSQADIFKARQLLGFHPQVAFEDGLRRTVTWYLTSKAVAGRV